MEGRGSILKRMAWEGVTDDTWRVLEGAAGGDPFSYQRVAQE